MIVRAFALLILYTLVDIGHIIILMCQGKCIHCVNGACHYDEIVPPNALLPD